MTTEKKPVTAYLSDELTDQLIKYCKSENLMRDYKDGQTKPQLGTAIVDVLESFFCIDNESSSSNMTTNITIRVNQKFKDDFIALAHYNGTTPTALFRQWMRDYLENSDVLASTNSDNTNKTLTERVNKLEAELIELKH